MMNEQKLKDEVVTFESKANYIEKMKFCIISQNKTISSRNRLLMFTMENTF